MHIEVFSAQKACEQGCAVCPMALKGKEVKATEIDPEVQKTFSILEGVSKLKSIAVTIHFTAQFHLFPDIKFPEIIEMIRFETSRMVREEGGAKHVSENIKTLLTDRGINPKILGFSIVPDSPVVSESDVKVLSEVLDEISKWYFKSKYKRIDITVRSNLIPNEKFKELKKLFFPADIKHLKGVVKAKTKLYKWDRKPRFEILRHESVYFKEYWGINGTNKISLTNRIITTRDKNANLNRLNRSRAAASIPHKVEDIDFAIAPKGVMISHSSITINNPIMWVNHSDFRNTLHKWMKIKKNFRILNFTQKLLVQNIIMFDYFVKRQKKDPTLSMSGLADFFERNRQVFKKF